MTLDEAIIHAEKVAEQKEKDARFYSCKLDPSRKQFYEKCANEHKQLAEWLKDYKRLLKQTGYWIKHGWDCWECSNCHNKNGLYSNRDSNYCPDCGAKMAEREK